VDEQQKRDESFDAQQADVPQLRTLREKVGAAVSELARHRTKILEAKLDGDPLQSHAKPTLLVERLIAVLIPETREIAARSQSPGELVLRRSLGGDRREEIFLSRHDLTLKLEPLDDRHRALFDSLFLEGGAATSRSSQPPPAPPPRAEPPAKPTTDGPGPSPLRRTPTPASVPAVAAAGEAARGESPLKVAVSTLAPPPASPAALPPSGPPHRASTPPFGVAPPIASPNATPPPSAEPMRATPVGGDAPLRRTASFGLRGPERPSAGTLDRPPPAAVTGEIGSAPEEKGAERGGPTTGT
jgi:hypothetical protein